MDFGPLIPLTSRFGWQPSGGTTLVEGHGAVVPFTLNAVITPPLHSDEINLYESPPYLRAANLPVRVATT